MKMVTDDYIPLSVPKHISSTFEGSDMVPILVLAELTALTLM